MIKFDEHGLPVTGSGDGGDSNVRASILTFTNAINWQSKKILEYCTVTGFGVRHPHQPPWSNRNNFSRDQQTMLIAGLHCLSTTNTQYQSEASSRLKAFYKNRKEDYFFAQNQERDWPGTKKHFYPHKMTGGDPVDEGKWRLLDGPDILAPNQIGQMLIASGQNTWFLRKIARPFHNMVLKNYAKSEPWEVNQMIAECYVYGTLGTFKQIFPEWQYISEKYWKDRDEIEYHLLLKEFINKY